MLCCCLWQSSPVGSCLPCAFLQHKIITHDRNIYGNDSAISTIILAMLPGQAGMRPILIMPSCCGVQSNVAGIYRSSKSGMCSRGSTPRATASGAPGRAPT